MSNTYKHKGKGYWNNGIEDKKEVKIFLRHCDRYNKEKSFFKPLEQNKKSNDIDKMVEEELLEYYNRC